MLALRVQLLGRFDIVCGGQATAALNNRSARELFCYLALHRDHPQRRETLAELFWKDATPAQARKNLRQAIWQIQCILRPLAGGADTGFLEVDPEWIQLNSSEQWQVDVARFESALQRCHGIPGAALDDTCRRHLEEAVDLYRGDLLEGWYQDWCVLERERFQNILLDVLEKLVCACATHHESERGLAHARRMLGYDPAREQVYRHLMHLYVIAGNRTQAIREYQRCERMLMQELGIKPSRQTVAMYEAIRDGRTDGPWHDTGDGIWLASPLAQLPALAEQLKRMQHLFAGLEARMQRDVAAPLPHAVKPD